MQPMTLSRVDDLIVGGGGVIGLAIAWLAARRGWKVRILDQRQIGRGASWAGAGILPPGAAHGIHDPIEQLRALSDAMFGDWCSLLQSETGIDVGLRRSGGLYLARTNGEFATLVANEAWWRDHGIEFQRWTPSETLQRVPALPNSVVSELKSAWFLPGERQIRNPRYLQALRVACQNRGVLIHEHESLEAIKSNDNSIEIQTKSARYEAQRVCITAGAWTPLTIPALQSQTGIFPVRGQMVLFRCNTQPFSSIINEGHRYLVPRDDGYVLAGSCEEEAGFDENTTPEMIEQLTQWARQLVPQLALAHIEKSWSGLRPGSIDGLPYLGNLPNHPNVYVAAGHYRHGLHFSPITAETMLALMTDEPLRIDLAPFRLTRGKTYSDS
jgi:glycine oxidase